MGLFSRLRRSGDALAIAQRLEASYDGIVGWESPRDQFKSLVLAELYDLEYQPVTRQTAMAISAVAKCRHLMAGHLGKMPLVAYRGNKPMDKQPLIVTQPEVGRPRFITMTWTADALMFFGRAWFTVTQRYQEDGRPARLRFVPEWEAEVIDGQLVKAYGVKVDPKDVIRVDGPHEGLLTFAGPRIREALAIDRAAARAADNPVPSIDLHQTGGADMSDAEIDALIERWGTKRRGVNGAIGYTNASIEARALGQPVEQLLIDGRNVAALNICRSLGFPAWAADVTVAGSSLTYSNVQSRTRELIENTYASYMAAIEARFSMDDILPAGVWAGFDTSGLLRGDFTERMNGYKAAIDAGIYTAEQCRALEAGRPLEEA